MLGSVLSDGVVVEWGTADLLVYLLYRIVNEQEEAW